MQTDEREFRSEPARTVADLDDNLVSLYWRDVVSCMVEVFGVSQQEAADSIARAQAAMLPLSDLANLLVYHDAPLNTAAILAGAERRPLTTQEMAAYDRLVARHTQRS